MSTIEKRFAYTLPVTVCLRDLDGLGHVNNAVYLTYLETARNTWVLQLRGGSRVADFDFILARTAINFRSPAEFLETLAVSVRPLRVGTTSWDFEYEIREVGSGRLIADAESTQVTFNYAIGRPAPVSEEFRRALEDARRACGC